MGGPARVSLAVAGRRPKAVTDTSIVLIRSIECPNRLC